MREVQLRVKNINQLKGKCQLWMKLEWKKNEEKEDMHQKFQIQKFQTLCKHLKTILYCIHKENIINVEFYFRREKTPERVKSWLFENIVVKVMTKSLGDKYYKQKGVIKKVVDSYGAEIKMIETGDKLKLDQVIYIFINIINYLNYLL